jgi:hypothetical protein
LPHFQLIVYSLMKLDLFVDVPSAGRRYLSTSLKQPKMSWSDFMSTNTSARGTPLFSARSDKAQLAIGVSDCATLERTAASQSLSIGFFTRLIRRKTNFDLRGWRPRRGAKHRPIYPRQYMLARIVGSIRGRRVYKESARQLRRRKYLSYGP